MVDYLWRLAVVLPLLLLGVVAVALVLRKQRAPVRPKNSQTISVGASGSPGGLTGLLAFWLAGNAGTSSEDATTLVVRIESLTPTVRVAVLRFGGCEHLLGLSGETMLLIARRPAAGCGPAAGAQAVPGMVGPSLPPDAGSAVARTEAGA